MGKRQMNVRLLKRFCHKHKKKTAEEIWQAMKYPEVNWEGLVDRFKTHHSHLLGIIDGHESHYRNDLAAKIERGEARSMKKEGNLTPGYYGFRGFDLMCDYLVEEFGELLKRRAVKDRVIAGRGAAAFIQCVLVAELAVRLIRDDMGVSENKAREIMEESKAVGEMLHDGAVGDDEV
ncbi:RTC4-like domain-containing protein [Ophiocordyceps camponoti-floridani]|uniref:Restriction of telomere capping protein 4 n=1 Tax=Ophiocordyceps camponoti-floridani TaxID=2030778 RepID=A0A8H4Q551_9HYPO|nr:RTC4-like domain-containing protein [Ophiocordyceps camponoti-floridani]